MPGADVGAARVAVLSLLGSAVHGRRSCDVRHGSHHGGTAESDTAPMISGQATGGEDTHGRATARGRTPRRRLRTSGSSATPPGTTAPTIAGATQKTYTVGGSDADKTLRVQVAATNADGSASATSKVTDVVSSKGGPVNTAAPAISGTPKVGEELDATDGIVDRRRALVRVPVAAVRRPGRFVRSRCTGATGEVVRGPLGGWRQHAARGRDGDEPRPGRHERGLGPDVARRRRTSPLRLRRRR